MNEIIFFVMKAGERLLRAASAPSDTEQFKAEIHDIINQLRTVKPGTTSYPEAQQLLAMAQKKL